MDSQLTGRRELLSKSSVARGRQAANPARRQGLHGLSALLATVLEPAARERGFARAALFAEWPRIVGAALASRCAPLAVDFPGGRARRGTLVLAAGPAAALELQHLAPQIIERINAFFGFPAIGRLRFRHLQPAAPRRPVPPPPRELLPNERERVRSCVELVGEPALREALYALGLDILRRQADAERGS